MRTSLLLALFAALHLSASAQDAPQKLKRFKVNVFHDKRDISSGFLVPLSDTMLRMVEFASAINGSDLNSRYRDFHYGSINKITVTRKGSVGKGLLIGTLAGIVLGTTIGYMSGDDPPCTPNSNDVFGLGYALCEGFRTTASEKAAMGAVVGGVLGAPVGIGIGALVRKKFIIGRRKQAFQDMHANMLQWIYLKK
jgi:hypothetical protein